ncbi:MAG: hypothetical protein LKJ49_02435 [Olsenella sp.]|nr:hypothetical protein [Olsenella sp.]
MACDEGAQTEEDRQFYLRHPRMPMSERAKIFVPFDALRGFREMLEEREREAEGSPAGAGEGVAGTSRGSGGPRTHGGDGCLEGVPDDAEAWSPEAFDAGAADAWDGWDPGDWAGDDGMGADAWEPGGAGEDADGWEADGVGPDDWYGGDLGADDGGCKFSGRSRRV